jgi:hypothetical protein
MQASQLAEYKQVTVVFADVVLSMEIAAAVGAERLREIMAPQTDRTLDRRRDGRRDAPRSNARRAPEHAAQLTQHRRCPTAYGLDPRVG